jgi:hypothetical protein
MLLSIHSRFKNARSLPNNGPGWDLPANVTNGEQEEEALLIHSTILADDARTSGAASSAPGAASSQSAESWTGSARASSSPSSAPLAGWTRFLQRSLLEDESSTGGVVTGSTVSEIPIEGL